MYIVCVCPYQHQHLSESTKVARASLPSIFEINWIKDLASLFVVQQTKLECRDVRDVVMEYEMFGRRLDSMSMSVQMNIDKF